MKLFRIWFNSAAGSKFGYFTPEAYTEIIGWCVSNTCPWRSMVQRTFPATIAFSGGEYADVYMAGGLFIANREVGDSLASRFRGLVIKEVLLAVEAPGRAEAYLGPPVCELWITTKVSWNANRSTLRPRKHCDACGRRTYDIVGVEELPHEEKIGDRWEMVPRRPRKPGMGVILSKSDLQGCDFFDYGNNFHMCTERAKEYIQSKGWTNIEFIEYGEVTED